MNNVLAINDQHSHQVACQFLFVLTLLIGSGGCQFFHLPPQGEAAIDQTAFQGYVDDHTQCITSHNLFDIQAVIDRLEQVPLPISAEDSPIPLPDFLVNLTSKPISRLAIDPKALAASCTLHAGQVALNQENVGFAHQCFTTLILKYPDPAYSYYVNQAHDSLQDLPTMKKTTVPNFQSMQQSSSLPPS